MTLKRDSNMTSSVLMGLEVRVVLVALAVLEVSAWMTYFPLSATYSVAVVDLEALEEADSAEGANVVLHSTEGLIYA